MKKLTKFSFSVVIFILATMTLVFFSSAEDKAWVTAWGSAPTNIGIQDFGNISFEGNDITARTVITPTANGNRIRFRFSNHYGKVPITINSATVADSTSTSTDPTKVKSGIDPESIAPITVKGKKQFTIPAGEEIITDAITYDVVAMKNIAVSFYCKNATEIRTMALSGASTFVTTTGDKTSEENFNILNGVTDSGLKDIIDIINRIPAISDLFDVSISAGLVRVVPLLTGMDVYTSSDGYSICVTGDSTVANEFPYYLAKRIAETNNVKNVGVYGKGIIGNTLGTANDTSLGSLLYGESLVERLDRDVLSMAGVKYVVVKIGANDIMHPVCTDATEEASKQPSANDIIKNFKIVIDRIHSKGAKAILCTITQWKGTTRDYFGNGGTYIRTEAEFEADWKIAKDVNSWITSSTNTYHDGYFDTAKISKSAIDADALDPNYTKDYIHPNATLQQLWAEKFPISLFGITKRIGNIRLNASTKTINVDEKYTLKVKEVIPADAANKTVKWTSSNPDVAQVYSSGTVVAFKPGTVTITCTAQDGSGVKATCKVTVKRPVSSVKLSKTSDTIYTRDSVTLKATVSPSDASDKSVTWTSSNTKVATVSSKGVVTGVGSGTATITCAAKDGSGKKATCKITVKKRIDVTMVSTNVSSKSLFIGGTYTLKATCYPTDATYKDVKFKSNDTSICTVDSKGLITAKKAGTVYIVVTSVDNPTVKAQVKITVKIRVTGLSASPANAVIVAGKTKQITPKFSPSNATDKRVTYKSSNKSVAKVNADGLITAVKPGVCEITLTSNEGGFKAVTTVQVIPVVKSKKITLNWSNKSIPVGEKRTLEVTFTPGDTTNKKVTFMSSDKKVATVNSKGEITAKSKGTCTITAVTQDTGKIAKCNVTVYNAPATSVKLNYPSAKLNVGQSVTIKATTTPANSSKAVNWKSSDTSVATVSSTGKVTAKKAGTTTITCTTYSGKKATCKVTVTNVKVSKIALSAKTVTLDAGKTKTIKATVSPSNAANKNITWKSSNIKVAKVSSSGKITAVDKGTATITCTAKDGSGVKATIKVTVNKVKVIGLKLSESKKTLKVGQTYTIKPTVLPATATNKAVTYSSLNTKVATVSSSGVVTAKAVGTATIKVVAKDGGAIALCTINVE